MITEQETSQWISKNLEGKTAMQQVAFLVNTMELIADEFNAAYDSWHIVKNELDNKCPVLGDFIVKVREYKAKAYPMSKKQIEYLANVWSKFGYWDNILKN